MTNAESVVLHCHRCILYARSAAWRELELSLKADVNVKAKKRVLEGDKGKGKLAEASEPAQLENASPPNDVNTNTGDLLDRMSPNESKGKSPLSSDGYSIAKSCSFLCAPEFTNIEKRDGELHCTVESFTSSEYVFHLCHRLRSPLLMEFRYKTLLNFMYSDELPALTSATPTELLRLLVLARQWRLERFVARCRCASCLPSPSFLCIYIFF
jgi:hypothetical protein